MKRVEAENSCMAKIERVLSKEVAVLVGAVGVFLMASPDTIASLFGFIPWQIVQIVGLVLLLIGTYRLLK